MSHYAKALRDEDLFEKARLYCATTTQISPDFVIRDDLGGEGSRLWGQLRGEEPRLFLDLASGIGVNEFGYGNSTPPALAVARQAELGVLHTAHNDWYGARAITVAERLATIAPGDFPKKVFFCSTGTESTANAAKVGYAGEENRLHAATVAAAVEFSLLHSSRRAGLISLEKAFHGRLGYSLEVTNSKPVHKRGFPPYVIRKFYLPFPDQGDPLYRFETWQNKAFKLLREWPLGTVNSYFFELVQGEGGFRFSDPQAIRFLDEYMRENKILGIVDEVQTAGGRTGTVFACEQYQIAPDMICLAKAFGGGIPFGAVIFRADLDPQPGQISNTYGGNSVACSAVLSVLDEVAKPAFLSLVVEKGKHLSNMLEDLAVKLSTSGRVLVRESGLGLMRKLEFRGPNGEPQPELCKKILLESLKRGLIVLTAGETAIRFLPPLTITDDELGEGIAILGEAVKDVLND